MGKKILYVVIIIALIIAGIFVAKQISGENDTKPTGANTVNNSSVKNEQDLAEENNITVENNIENNNTQTSDTTGLTPEEQAKQIVKENWGEDDSVYYSYDGKDENGKYIICVREKTTTKALYWYYVDVETGTFNIK